jgi:hypothetical protein
MYQKQNESREEYLTRMKRIGSAARATLTDEEMRKVNELLASANAC